MHTTSSQVPASPTHSTICANQTMASQPSFQSSGHSGFLPPVMVEKGKWAWHEPSGQLIFQKRRMSRKKSRPWLSSALLDFKQEVKEMKAKATQAKEKVEERTITLEDVKAVAVGLVSEDLVRKMTKRTALIFDECCRTEQMHNFLWAVLMYFEAYLEHDKAKSDENVYTPGSLGKAARQRLKKCEYQLRQRQTNLGHIYMGFVLGLGHRNSHHTKAGRSKVSKTHTDQHLFETICEFTMYVTWITFGYEHWKTIRDEIGRILRTTAFNKDFKESEDDFFIELDGMGTIYKDSDEYLSYRIFYDRPTVGSLRNIRSPLMVNYFPSSREKSAWAFEPPYKPPKSRKEKVPLLPKQESPPAKLGIIGQPLSDYDPETLRYIERSDSELESDTDDEDGESEMTEEIYEDNTSSGLIDIDNTESEI